MKSMKPKQQLILQGKEGLTSNENDCAQILTDHFSKVFFSEEAAPMPVIPPAEMRTPFHHNEVKKAVNSMKNNKGCGCEFTEFGCCPDDTTTARGSAFEGCGCVSTEHGCCPDKFTPAPGPNMEGCPCHTYEYGCCPDGESIAR